MSNPDPSDNFVKSSNDLPDPDSVPAGTVYLVTDGHPDLRGLWVATGKVGQPGRGWAMYVRAKLDGDEWVAITLEEAQERGSVPE